MAKKFWGIFSLVICIMLCGLCFSACGQKEVTVQGTINIEFDGFTHDDISGTMYFSFSGPAANNLLLDTENGVKAVFGPEKTKNKDNFVVDIFLTDIYDVDLDVVEKNGKNFNISKRDSNTDDQHFYINIPYAENIDYNLKISKPKPHINQVYLDISSNLVNSADEKVKDFLDHSQIWVENKEYNPTTNKYVAGFMPIVSGQDNAKQFNLEDKYINAAMTEETFTLYLKYDNSGRTLPFSVGNIFSKPATVRTATLDGEKVYAFDFQTQDLSKPYIIKINFGSGLEYLSAPIYDNSGSLDIDMIDGDSYLNGDLHLFFKRVGWKLGSNENWQTTTPNRVYGQKLTLKYEFENFSADDAQSSTLKDIFDFANIKFQINGKTVTTTYEVSEGTHTYTIVIGEYDTPETYAENYALEFEIGIDRNSIKAKASQDVREVVYSSNFEFGKGNDNIILSNFNEGGYTNHVNVYTKKNESAYSPFNFTLINLAMYERFTLTITLGAKIYTKEFVLGQDYLTKVSGMGQLAGAYVFESITNEKPQYLRPTGDSTDSSVYYYFKIDNETNTLTLSVDYQQSQKVEVKLSGIKYREIAFDANGEMYAGRLAVQEDLLTDKVKEILVEFDLNQMYTPDSPNFNIRATLYSNDVLIGYYDLVSGEIKFEIGDIVEHSIFNFSHSSSSSTPDIVLKFYTNGRISVKWSNDTWTNILITKIVVTLGAAN